MLGYLLTAFGFGAAIFILWAALSRREKSRERLATYICTHCGENDCICHQASDADP